MGLLTRLAIGAGRRSAGRQAVGFLEVLKKPQKILCYPAQDGGELLLAIPAIRAIRKHYRESVLSLLVDESKRWLWHFDTEADQVIDFHPSQLKGLSSGEYRRLRRVIAANKFDLLIDLNYRPIDLMSYLLSRCGIAVRYGQETGDDYPFKNFLVRGPGLPGDEAMRSLALIRPLGAYSGQHPTWPRLVGQEGKREFREKLKEQGLKRGQSIVTLDAGNWKIKNLQSVLALLSRDSRLRLAMLNPPPHFRASDQLTIIDPASGVETAEVLAQSRGFIGSKNDLFSMAYIQKVPCLITVPSGTKGLPAAGEHLSIRIGRLPFELGPEELEGFLQKIF